MESLQELIKMRRKFIHSEKGWNKNRKTDQEVLDYLKPYQDSTGVFLKNQVTVEIGFGHISVDVDVKSGFDNPNESNRIKKFLKRNGFIRNYGMGFVRALNDKDTNIDLYNVRKYMFLATGKDLNVD